jgi:hypothetical protein
MLDVVDKITSVLGLSIHTMNTCKGLAALLTGYADKFDIGFESKSKSAITRSTGPILIGEQLRIPPLFLEGVLHSLQNKDEETQNILISLCNV